MTEYGRPVLSGVFVSFPHGGTAFRPTARQEAELLNAKDADLVTIKGRTSTLKPSAQMNRWPLLGHCRRAPISSHAAFRR